MRVVLLLVMATGCGRIGYELREQPVSDAQPLVDSAATCPANTAEVAISNVVGSLLTCIEIVERGTMTWTDAKATCEGLGRRLCLDAEWASACSDTKGLVDMAGDAVRDWEWVAEEVGGVAQKRGYDFCSDMSAHEIFVDSYDFRCCVDI